MRLQLTQRLLLLGVLLIGPAHGVRADEAGTTVTSDNMLYTDTDNVDVFSSEAAVHHNFDAEGTMLEGSAIIDVVSAASVDVLSHATTGFHEVRVEGNVSGAYALGDSTPGLRYRFSVEPDYESQGVGGSWSQRLGSPDSVLSASYFLSLDTVGRHGTPFGVWSETLRTHTFDLSFTQNLDSKTILRGAYTLTAQNGYLEKPYRYVPLFTQQGLQSAADDGVDLNLKTFSNYRIGTRPAEEVPDTRLRHALGLRAMRYLDGIPAALRLDYRFYFDNWQQRAHTVELAVDSPLSDAFRASLYGRAYLQSDAYFWRKVYVVDDTTKVPTYRSADRQLSDYWTGTVGGRLDLTLGDFRFDGQVNLAYTHFNDFLYLTSRWALIAQLGIRWTP